MKFYIYLLISILFISGCYTMVSHPEVEVYYERENGEEYLTEEYNVFVDEDCTTCHESFLPQKHFAPLIPAHDLSVNWNDLPWWLDTKYLMFFSDGDDSSSASTGYQHAISQKRINLPPPQQGGYISGSGGSSSSGGSAAVTPSQPSEQGSSKSRTAVSSQNSGSNSKSSSSSSSKRKFRKRK